MLNQLTSNRLRHEPLLSETPDIIAFVDDVMKARAFTRAAEFRNSGFLVVIYVRPTLNGTPDVETVMVKEVA